LYQPSLQQRTGIYIETGHAWSSFIFILSNFPSSIIPRRWGRFELMCSLTASFALGKHLLRQGCGKPLTRATEGSMYPPNFFDGCNIISVKERNPKTP
jgi:hypothetical protein